MKADAYLFDIDGTLVNCRDAVHYHAFNHALRDVYRISSTIDQVPVHGNTDIGILRAAVRAQGISDVEFESRLPRALEQMRAEVQANAASLRPEVCAGIADWLRSLRAAGKVLGVVSGNLEPIGWAKLEKAGLRKYFDFGSFSGDHELRKQIFHAGIQEAQRRIGGATSADQSRGTPLRPQRPVRALDSQRRTPAQSGQFAAAVCVVGDTPADIEAAQENGVPVIAIATGIFGVDELRRFRPDACFANCTELLRRTQQ